MNIGPYQVYLLETGRFWLDGGAMFGIVPKTLWSRTNPSDEKNRVELGMKVLLIFYEDHKILVNVGAGHKFPPRQQEIYRLEYDQFDLKKSLRAHNVNPEEITDLVLTHCHFDHAGGATEYSRDGLQLTFPNAIHYLQRTHWDWALNPTDRDRGSFLREDIEPLKRTEKLKILEGEYELFPGFHLLLSNGHTVGMQMVKIQDAGTTLFYSSDLIPTTSHLALPYIMGYDIYPLTTLEEKRRLLNQACDEDWVIALEHDSKLDGIRVQKGEKRIVIKETLKI